MLAFIPSPIIWGMSADSGRISVNRISLIGGLFLIGVLPLPATAADEHVVVSPDNLKWGAAPPAFPKGAQIAVLSGDPSMEGLYVVRLKLPAGYKVPPHTHPNDENITVISGTFNIGMGDKLDEKKGDALKAGGFARAPKGMQHYAWFTEDTIVQLHGMGPQSIIYVNPADDPRKSN
jgi:quercetin dioxygenase-like cupin family protein